MLVLRFVKYHLPTKLYFHKNKEVFGYLKLERPSLVEQNKHLFAVRKI